MINISLYMYFLYIFYWCYYIYFFIKLNPVFYYNTIIFLTIKINFVILQTPCGKPELNLITEKWFDYLLSVLRVGGAIFLLQVAVVEVWERRWSREGAGFI